MPGSVIEVLVKEGEAVEKGQALMIIEAMKMEHTIAAPMAGRVCAQVLLRARRAGQGRRSADRHSRPSRRDDIAR